MFEFFSSNPTNLFYNAYELIEKLLIEKFNKFDFSGWPIFNSILKTSNASYLD